MGDIQVTNDESAIIISDASVLIDYVKANRKILPLVSRYIGRIHVPRPVFDEVEQIDEQETERLGLTIAEPELPQILEASKRGGPLSRSDKLTLIMARDLGCACWTSDASLKKKCEDQGVRVYWGLEIMLVLCEKGHLSKHVAIRTARTIKANGAFISEDVLKDFEKKVNDI